MEDTNCLKCLSGNGCDMCEHCLSCLSCNHCFDCKFCFDCLHCEHCFGCKSLKMTEDNIFCYSYSSPYEIDRYGDSYRQKPYRIFNREIGGKGSRYDEIEKEIEEILKGLTIKLKDDKSEYDSGWSIGWGEITNDQWRRLLSIPEANNFKEGFEYISGVKINLK